MDLFFCAICFPFIALIIYLKKIFDYWKGKNVLNLPITIPCGNADSTVTQQNHLFVNIGKLYDFIKSTNYLIHGGFYYYTKPIYVPISPDLIGRILSKDFDHFAHRDLYFHENVNPSSANLGGSKWKTLRIKLATTFASVKTEIFVTSTKNMIRHIDEVLLPSNGCINLKEVMDCYETHIVSAAFGLECDNFKNFHKYRKKLFVNTFWDELRDVVVSLMPLSLKKIGLPLFQSDAEKFFTNLIKETAEYREKNKTNFLQILIDNKEETSALQCFLFLLKGFEISATTATFALYEMALNPALQGKARNEVLTVLKKHDGEITYDGVMEMKYVRQVIDETLRKYPTLPLLNRKVTKAYQVRGTDLILDEGTLVFIPAYSIHHDPEYYPNPEQFDPDRFTEEEKQKRPQYTYLPFGDGPRNCIGTRFGILQTKMALVALLKNYRISLDTRTKVPLEFDPTNFLLATKRDVYLNFQSITLKHF